MLGLSVKFYLCSLTVMKNLRSQLICTFFTTSFSVKIFLPSLLILSFSFLINFLNLAVTAFFKSLSCSSSVKWYKMVVSIANVILFELRSNFTSTLSFVWKELWIFLTSIIFKGLSGYKAINSYACFGQYKDFSSCLSKSSSF